MESITHFVFMTSLPDGECGAFATQIRMHKGAIRNGELPMQRPSPTNTLNPAVQRLLDTLEEQACHAGLAAEPVQRLRQELECCHRAEQHFSQQAQQYKALVEHAPDIIARFDPQLRCSYINPQIERYTGKRPEQILGKSLRETGIPAPLRDLWETKLRETFARHHPVTFEFSASSPSGEPHCHQAHLVPEFDASTHQVQSVMAVCRDITDAKRTERPLLENQAWIKSLVDHNLDGLFSLDRVGRFTAANPACEKISGYSVAELLTMTFTELCTPDCLQRAVEAFKQDRDGNPQTVELAIRAKNGRRVELLATGGPIFSEGHIVGVFAIVQDITERKRIEKALRDSEEQFRLLVDGVKDYALFLLDPNGNIVNWNKGAERLKGYRAEEIIGRSSSLCFVPDDILHGDPQRRLEIAKQEGHYKGECWVVRKDGSRFWGEVLITALHNSDGSLRGFAEVAQDITERKRVEEELKRAKEAAEAASRAKDQFLAVLSHELRTPLTPVLTTVQLMAKDPALPPRQRDSLAIMQRNIELEARLIDDLLDLTRISRGKQELHLGLVDLHSILRHVLAVCDSDIRAKQLRLTTDLRAPHPHLHADAARLQQVFWNLLKNAIKFTPAGGHIALRTDQSPDNCVIVTLSDTGVGIDPALLPRIFNLFEQGGADVTRLFGGLGLGLFISKGLVDLHGGTLAASSPGKGQGATFTVTLPTAPITPAPASPSSLTPAQTPAHKGARILLVEDHPDTARTMTLLLRSYGYDVRVADSVGAALQAADAEPFDLIISDLGLPDGSGLDLMRQLTIKHPTKGIAVSGFGMEEDIQMSHAAGFAAHLTKPIDVQNLETIMRDLVG